MSYIIADSSFVFFDFPAYLTHNLALHVVYSTVSVSCLSVFKCVL